MITTFRYLYILLGAVGLAFLFLQVIIDFNDINTGKILVIAMIDIVLFYLAYKTYPDEVKA